MSLVAWRIKDFCDGWILTQDIYAACRARKDGYLVQRLYALNDDFGRKPGFFQAIGARVDQWFEARRIKSR